MDALSRHKDSEVDINKVFYQNTMKIYKIDYIMDDSKVFKNPLILDKNP